MLTPSHVEAKQAVQHGKQLLVLAELAMVQLTARVQQGLIRSVLYQRVFEDMTFMGKMTGQSP